MISVCILTKNAEKTLSHTLETTRAFPEVLLLDNGSEDTTLEIAKKYPNVKICHSPFLGFGPLRNLAASLAAHDWILALDSDETLPSPLVEEILSMELNSQTAYAISRRNFYNGKWISGCGWHPEWVYRLYHRKTASFGLSQVHESLKIENLQKKRLRFSLHHTPYRSTEDFLQKMQLYTTLFAQEHHLKKKSSFPKALLHGLFAFFKSYLLKRGIFLGKEGLAISIYNGNTAFYKYLKLRELNKSHPRDL